MLLLNRCPHLSIFPYPLYASNATQARRQRVVDHKREGDWLFAYTLSHWFAWELGERSCRVASFRTALGPTGDLNFHLWVGIICGGFGQKQLAIYDPSGDKLETDAGFRFRKGDLMASQRRLIGHAKRKNIAIKEVWWCGRPVLQDGDPKRCLENSMLFMEQFCTAAE